MLLPFVRFDLLRDVRRSRDAVEVEAAAAAVLAVGPYPGAASFIVAREPRAIQTAFHLSVPLLIDRALPANREGMTLPQFQ